MFSIDSFDVSEYDAILACGLSRGLGERGHQVCIQAAICRVLDIPHSDDPMCVAESVRFFEIGLNDAGWSSPQARAKGMRDLGLAQLGSKGVVCDSSFARILSRKLIRRMIPALFRDVLPEDESCLAAAKRCEEEGSAAAASAAARASASARTAARACALAASSASALASARAAASASACAFSASAAAAGIASACAFSASAAASASARACAFSASDSASASASAAASAAARASARAASARAADKYLILAADCALEALREMKSPGIALIRAGGGAR